MHCSASALHFTASALNCLCMAPLCVVKTEDQRYWFPLKFTSMRPNKAQSIVFVVEFRFKQGRVYCDDNKRFFLVADTRLYTLPCRSARRSVTNISKIASGFCITAPAQQSVTGLPCFKNFFYNLQGFGGCTHFI